MMAVVTSASAPSALPAPALYSGLSLRSSYGFINIVTIDPNKDQVFYTVNGVLARHHKTQDGFRQTFMSASAP